jgi:hypothetical protein
VPRLLSRAAAPTSRLRTPLRLVGASILIAAVFAAASLSTPVSALAAPEPSKWVLSSQIGWNVNLTKVNAVAPQEERNECTVASKDSCQHAEEGVGPRGFLFPESVAVNKTKGDVYIGENANHRVQVLDAKGAFVRIFGWNVNKTRVALGGGATQQEKNVCTASSKDECGPGIIVVKVCTGGSKKCSPGEEEGTPGLAGQMLFSGAVTIDQATGNVYVLDARYHRVQEFTASGEFVLMIGGGVNKKGGSVCTKAEEVECQAGVEGTGQGAFEERGENGIGTSIAVGPTDHLVYVGDEARVQKFEANGKWAGQLSLAGLSATGLVRGVAVDAAGDVFVVDEGVAGVHELNAGGTLQSCVIDPAGTGGGTGIQAIALDAFQRLGVIEWTPIYHGAMFESQGGKCGARVGGDIVPPSGEMLASPRGVAFSLNGPSEDRLYVATGGGEEIETYAPVLFPEVRTCPTTEPVFTGARLCGEVNPNALSTRGFFRFGTTENGLTSETATAFTGSGVAFEPVHLSVTGLVPNQMYFDEAFVEAETEGKPATAGGPPAASFHTRTPAPEVPGEPLAPVVRAQSVVLSAVLNPEHAATRYHFEFAPCASELQTLPECGAVGTTADLQSAQYGQLASIQEAGGLASETHYAFRLVADNRFVFGGEPEGGQTAGQEGHFTTGRLPSPQAQTDGVSSITATSAVIAGMADPDGQPASYAFELGVYNGPSTQYGVVFSGPAGAGGWLEQTLPLAGLQPGTTYAYRIAVKSGYGEATGATLTFTTLGLPSVLVTPTVVALLPIPAVAFPVDAPPKPPAAARCKRGFVHKKVKGKLRCVKQTHRKGHKALRHR